MQQKKSYGDKLLEQKKSAEQRNVIRTIFTVLALMIFTYGGEVEELPLSRIITLCILYLIFRKYNEVNKDLSRALRHYTAEQIYLNAALNNDKNTLKGLLDILKFHKVNISDPDTGKNVLHMAVEGKSIEVINFLLQIDRWLAAQPDFCNQPNIFNHQDNEGNTPIHHVINRVLKNEDPGLLVSLITVPREGLFASTKYKNELPIRNERIDIHIENSNGESIKDLIGRLFRSAAQLNNVALMKPYLSLLTLDNMGICGKESKRNALHFAARQGSHDAIKFLMLADAKRASTKGSSQAQTELKRSFLINQQDFLNGNTPVHDAIEDILNKKQKDYTVLFALVGCNQRSQVEMFGATLPHLNTSIDCSLTNNARQTIIDLAKKLPDSLEKQKVMGLLKELEKENSLSGKLVVDNKETEIPTYE